MLFLFPLDMKLAKFMDAMSEKLMKSDEDQDIRHTFMAFDSQCKIISMIKIYFIVNLYFTECKLHFKKIRILSNVNNENELVIILLYNMIPQAISHILLFSIV